MLYYEFHSSVPGHRQLKKNVGQLLMKRLFETSLSALFLVILAPIWLVKRKKTHSKLEIYSTENPIYLSVSCGISQFSDLQRQAFFELTPVFWEIFCGRMSLVGAAPVETFQGIPLYQAVQLKPSLFSTYSLKHQANLTCDDRDFELLSYISQASLQTDFWILVRSLIGRLYSQTGSVSPESFDIFGVKVNNLRLDDAMEWIVQSARDHSRVDQLAFANPDCFNIAVEHTLYRETLNRADRVLADGIGVHLACRMLDLTMKDNLNGTDLFPRLCVRAQAEQLSIFFLGAAHGVVDRVVSVVETEYPKLKIAGYHHGFFNPIEENNVINQINSSRADILLVAFGAPRQDIWIANNKDKLHVGLAMGVGGLFDFVSGSVPRAPLWMREIGLEWCFRLYQEPKRMWRRYIIGNPLFLFRVWRGHTSLPPQRPEV